MCTVGKTTFKDNNLQTHAQPEYFLQRKVKDYYNKIRSQFAMVLFYNLRLTAKYLIFSNKHFNLLTKHTKTNIENGSV